MNAALALPLLLLEGYCRDGGASRFKPEAKGRRSVCLHHPAGPLLRVEGLRPVKACLGQSCGMSI